MHFCVINQTRLNYFTIIYNEINIFFRLINHKIHTEALHNNNEYQVNCIRADHIPDKTCIIIVSRLSRNIMQKIIDIN